VSEVGVTARRWTIQGGFRLFPAPVTLRACSRGPGRAAQTAL
jgi:hypothetical protein